MKKDKQSATSKSSPTVPPPEPETADTDSTMYEYEHVMTFDNEGTAGPSAGSSSAAQQATFKKRKSVKSDASVELRGPMEVDGSVKSMGGITFSGDFSVRDRIEAYGNIDINGNLTCKYVVLTSRADTLVHSILLARC
jgi:hypothetical protein